MERDGRHVLSEKKDFAQAITAFETALKQNPRLVNAHFGLSVALADAGEPRRAFEALDKLFAAGRPG